MTRKTCAHRAGFYPVLALISLHPLHSVRLCSPPLQRLSRHRLDGAHDLSSRGRLFLRKQTSAKRLQGYLCSTQASSRRLERVRCFHDFNLVADTGSRSLRTWWSRKEKRCLRRGRRRRDGSMEKRAGSYFGYYVSPGTNYRSGKVVIAYIIERIFARFFGPGTPNPSPRPPTQRARAAAVAHSRCQHPRPSATLKTSSTPLSSSYGPKSTCWPLHSPQPQPCHQ